MPILRLLVGVRHAEQGDFVEMTGEKLESDRQSLGKTARYRDAGDTGHVCWNRENVGEVHLVGIVGACADRKRDGGGGRRDDDVDLRKRCGRSPVSAAFAPSVL